MDMDLLSGTMDLNNSRMCLPKSGKPFWLSSNLSILQKGIFKNCSTNVDNRLSRSGGEMILEYGHLIHAYLTPIIIIIGLIGNLISLRVFTSKSMRQLSSSLYLATLSASDSMVLLTYVLLEWLKHGLPWICRSFNRSVPNVQATQGFCQLRIYLAYSFRLISVGLIVMFTVERFIGVTMPLKRRELCTHTSAKRAVMAVVVLSLLLCLFKPFTSGVVMSRRGQRMCAGYPDLIYLNYLLDSAYGIILTALPFLIIATLNSLILRQLILTKRRHQRSKFINHENMVKLEFTFILLLISTCFIALNLPYFLVWCLRHWADESLFQAESRLHLRGAFFITRTIFYVNYCINFFLYSLTGAYFRHELCVAFSFLLGNERKQKLLRRKGSGTISATQIQTSWV